MLTSAPFILRHFVFSDFLPPFCFCVVWEGKVGLRSREGRLRERLFNRSDPSRSVTSVTSRKTKRAKVASPHVPFISQHSGSSGWQAEKGDALAPLPVLKSRLSNLPKPTPPDLFSPPKTKNATNKREEERKKFAQNKRN